MHEAHDPHLCSGMGNDIQLVFRSGDLVMRGNGTYSELFSAGSGNRYLSGFQGQLNIKHDGSGSVGVDPGASKLNHPLHVICTFGSDTS